MNTVLVSEAEYDISPQELRKGSVFGALSDKAIHYLLAEGTIHKVITGDDVFHYGDKGDNFYIVLHGSLDFFKQHNKKTSHTRVVNFGEAVGFVAMIALHDRVGTAVALEDSLLLEVSSNLFSDFHDAFPFDFGIFLLNLSRDMARTITALGDVIVEAKVKNE
ncbi:cyclic nucleotide-binding domain-containing protein [Marinomonas transparens]|uniref:Cyclic nucleotide-binding domain-containing protein n=1 Tax=Marinomonas transparens TaxID=2795388 RepID=A0A934JL67_9GAMM|nr:cyclic nucleotide-binding domain-containing protein [Marinomonas transparens]MBJ7538170.1 cyclic nucleotide-binding domain-containing protein [Marinomonas transparens]